LRLGFRKLGIVCLVAAVVLTLGVFRPGADTPTAEADIWTPGGLIALPSFFPGLPGLTDQVAPAIIPASGPGSTALIGVFADPLDLWLGDFTNGFNPDCSSKAGPPDGITQYCFQVEQAYPTAGGSTAASLSSRICGDGLTCDLTVVGGVDNAPGVVVITLAGGGKDQMVTVTATDESGQSKSVDVVMVQTMLAVPPVVEPGQTPLVPGLEGIALVGYRCPDVGAAVFDAAAVGLPGVFMPSTLGEMFDWIYGTLMGIVPVPAVGPAVNLYRCGGDTVGNSLDDLVAFQTDLGQLTIQPMLVVPAPVFVPGMDCPQGKSVSVVDANITWPAAPPGPPVAIQNCDLDGAPNGTVGYLVQRTADVGVATITGQQGGMAGSTRQTNVNFLAGPAAGLIPSIMLFGEGLSALPTAVSPLTQLEVTALVVNQALNPVGGITVSCSVDPVSGAFAMVSDRDTTGLEGMAEFQLIPTGLPGTEVTLSCSLDGYPDIPPATHTFSLTLQPDLEAVDLVAGCNPIASTWPDGTGVKAIAAGVAPEDALASIWAFDTATGTWLGYSPTAPAGVSDLDTVDRLDAIFICVDADATVSRPVI